MADKNLQGKGDERMKIQIKNCLAATGLSLILLGITATLYNASFLCIESIFQIFAANILIQIVLYLFRNFESQYFLVEICMEMGCVLLILIVFGFLFNWYSSTPIWVLMLIGVSVYLIGSLIDIFRVKNDVAYINRQLKLNKERSDL